MNIGFGGKASVFAPKSDIIPSPLEEYRRFIDDPLLFTAVPLYIRSLFSLCSPGSKIFASAFRLLAKDFLKDHDS